MEIYKLFAKTLLEWGQSTNRQLPWKADKDPYKIWLSEIILQQTRVEQGLKYFHRFVEAFPTILDLAKADEQMVIAQWQGLGYYSRARNLHASAKYIAFELDAVFPSTYEDLLKLKGVGPYTAAAIGSFAFDLPTPVVDTNVFRLFARLFFIEEETTSSKGKKQFQALAEQLIDKDNPAAYNQAIMDFGGLVCKPRNPDCLNCVFQDHCLGFKTGNPESLPVKKAKKAKRKRVFHYFLLENGNGIALRQRKGKDIWQEMYELPMIESEKSLSEKEILDHDHFLAFAGKDSAEITLIHQDRQQLTHQTIDGLFWKVSGFVEGSLQFYSLEELSTLAYPGLIYQFLLRSGHVHPT